MNIYFDLSVLYWTMLALIMSPFLHCVGGFLWARFGPLPTDEEFEKWMDTVRERHLGQINKNY